MDLIPPFPREPFLMMLFTASDGQGLADGNTRQLMKGFAKAKRVIFIVRGNWNQDRIFSRTIGETHPRRKLEPKLRTLMVLKRFNQPLKRFG